MFVAVPLPSEAREDLEDFLEPRRDAFDLRWSPGEQWHVTLAFLANVSDRAYDGLLARLERAASKRHPLTLTVAGGGAFPAVGHAKVLWAGLDGSPRDAEELRRMALGARAAAGKAGIDVEGAAFRPHVTVGRMRRPGNAIRWAQLMETYRGPSFEVDEIRLVQSFLGEGPRHTARHEVVAAFPLASAAVSSER